MSPIRSFRLNSRRKKRLFYYKTPPELKLLSFRQEKCTCPDRVRFYNTWEPYCDELVRAKSFVISCLSSSTLARSLREKIFPQSRKARKGEYQIPCYSSSESV